MTNTTGVSERIDPSSNDATTFGVRLKQARKDANLTQKELARKAGISQTTISDIEGERNASSSEIPLLASILGVEALWLQLGVGEKHRGGKPFDHQSSLLQSLDTPYDLSSQDRRFIQDILDAIEGRAIPPHVKQTVLMLLSATPLKR